MYTVEIRKQFGGGVRRTNTCMLIFGIECFKLLDTVKIVFNQKRLTIRPAGIDDNKTYTISKKNRSFGFGADGFIDEIVGVYNVELEDEILYLKKQ